MALTCHEIGIPCQVFERVREMQPLGVGINLQPNAVRELQQLGLGPQLDEIGIQAQEWALVSTNGRDVWSEPRGRKAGYRWPQYSVHRGQLQMMLYDAVVERLGAEAVLTGHQVTGYSNTADGVAARVENRATGEVNDVEGSVLLAADGLHSALRAQLYPEEGEPVWGGAVLWRGTALGPPVRTGASFVLLGTLEQRFVTYPISKVDPETGLQVQNWIAELTFDPAQGWGRSDWNTQVDASEFLPRFEGWVHDWIDVPELIRGADAVFEYPMVDRDPVPNWVDGSMALMGDAAHVMYPVGSNGASQAIVDARVLGACFLEHGVIPGALAAYQDQLLDDMSALVLRNRGSGPVGILGVVQDRCGGEFDDIEDVIDRTEIEEFMARYKAAAGFAIETLNGAPDIIQL